MAVIDDIECKEQNIGQSMEIEKFHKEEAITVSSFLFVIMVAVVHYCSLFCSLNNSINLDACHNMPGVHFEIG